MSWAQHGALLGLRLFHLDDHVGLGKHLCSIRHQRGTSGHVERITHANAVPCAHLHQHLVAVLGEFAHTGRGQAHAVFVVFDFLGESDQHGWLS